MWSLTVVAVGAEAVGGVDVVERRRPRVPELDVVGPGAEAAQVVAGVGRQQVLHRRRRSATQAALDSIRTRSVVCLRTERRTHNELQTGLTDSQTVTVAVRKKHACLCDLADHEMAVDSPGVRRSRERGQEEQQNHRKRCGCGRLHPDF